MVDININILAAEKLLEMFSSGVASVAGPWIMRREAAARADSIRLIAQAQTDAAETYKKSGNVLAFNADISVTESIQAGMQFRAKKEMDNIMSVVHEAGGLLGDKEVPNKPVDPDWSARFFSDVKDVSSAELRTIWARILAGEVETPGRASLRTLDVLKNMTQEDAKMFERFACYLVFDEHSDRAAVFNPPWGGIVGGDELQDMPMHDAKTCQVMQEIGLFMAPDEEGWKRWGYIIKDLMVPVVHGLGEHCGLALATTPLGPRTPPTKLSVISATRAGREIAGFLLDDCPPHDQYLACLARCVQRRSGQLFSAKIVGKNGGGKLQENWREITGEWER